MVTRSKYHEGVLLFPFTILVVCIFDNLNSQGYLNNPKATQESITLDGWFKTGDIATRDPEGYYYIVDRRKELIKYKV
jgi:acyl-CoA synthetase (AMP-forming)/AMP-acid ligase II